jgi:Undecaprenyl-phosphate galactose phosphotransferase WbaP
VRLAKIPMNPTLDLFGTRVRGLARAESRARPITTALVLAGADAAGLMAAAALATSLWRLANPAAGTFYGMWSTAPLFLVTYAVLGLYPGVGLSPVEELRRLTGANAIVFLALAGTIFLHKDVATFSRGIFVVKWLLSTALVPLARAGARSLFARRLWWGVPILIFGAGRAAHLVIGALKSQPGLGLKPLACLDDGEHLQRADCAGIEIAGGLADAPAIGRAYRIRHALVAMPSLSAKQLIEVLERRAAAFPHVIIVPDLLGMASLWVTARDLGGVLGLELRQNLLVPLNRRLKRGLDLALCAVLGLVAAPLVALAALLIKRVNPGPAFYAQDREGEGGSTIRVHKLRTMYLNADALLREHLEHNPAAREEWRRHFKLKNDPRVLPVVGHLLRRTSLDELPQLWNVLRGEMSLVGPRPFPFYHLDQFDGDFRRLRGQVPPGLTGLWQVEARSDGDLAVQEKLDTYYIRNWSLWLDAYILARTVRAVLARSGAY